MQGHSVSNNYLNSIFKYYTAKALVRYWILNWFLLPIRLPLKIQMLVSILASSTTHELALFRIIWRTFPADKLRVLNYKLNHVCL